MNAQARRAHLYVTANITGIVLTLITIWILCSATKASTSWFVMPKPSTRRREGPEDLMRGYVQYLKDNGYEDKPVRPTIKAWPQVLRWTKSKESAQ
jgi:hypothetical protein